jgi:hypothetical protein
MLSAKLWQRHASTCIRTIRSRRWQRDDIGERRSNPSSGWMCALAMHENACQRHDVFSILQLIQGSLTQVYAIVEAARYVAEVCLAPDASPDWRPL